MTDLTLSGLLTEKFVKTADEGIYELMKREVERGLTYEGQALLYYLNENSKCSIERYKEKMKAAEAKPAR